MPPPPVTPSPHRFVIKKEPPIRKPAPPPPQQTPRPSTQQFNSTPRFTFSSTPRPTASQIPPRATPSASKYLTPGTKASKAQDTIHISSSASLPEVHDSIEVDEQEADIEYGSAEEDDDFELDEPFPKRRRVSSSPDGVEEIPAEDEPEHPPSDFEDLLSSSVPTVTSPAPRRAPTASHKFLLSTPAPPSTPLPTSTTQIFLKPPRFRPPDPAEAAQAQGDPLPEQFSPHRRGQKYVAGGLAAEVRDWLVNIESALPAAGGAKREKEEWLARVVIDEVSGGSKAGMTLVRSRRVHDVDGDGDMEMLLDTGGEVRIILAGEGQGTGLQNGKEVERGRMVGIKGPVWEVVVEGEKWGVGVNWKVL